MQENSRRAEGIDTVLAIVPFIIYFISFILFIPSSIEKWTSHIYPAIFYYLSWLYIAGLVSFILFKQFQRDSFYVWLSFSIYFSLSTIIGNFNPFHLFNNFQDDNRFGIVSLNRAWIVALISVFLMVLFRKIMFLRPNRVLYPILVFFFCLSHHDIYTMDLLSFGGVHVDFYNPFPWIHRIMIPILIIFILSVILLSVIKRRSLHFLYLILLFLAHALAWNQSRYASIQHYTHTLALIRSAGEYAVSVLGTHFVAYFLKSGLFLFLLLFIFIPRKKKTAPALDGEKD